MADRMRILGDDDEPWSKIRPPWEGHRDWHRYILAALGDALCRRYQSNCVRTTCPVDDPRAGDHWVTICKRGDKCNDVGIRCEETHTPKQVVAAILAEIRGEER